MSIRKQYAGHAKRVMFGLWSILRQFMYTKFIVVVDEDIDPRDWKEVVWAMTTRMDPVRDTLLVENTPIDYLDFASPVSGLGGKMGLDATNKWPGETSREWGTPIVMDAEVKQRVDAMWSELALTRRRAARGLPAQSIEAARAAPRASNRYKPFQTACERALRNPPRAVSFQAWRPVLKTLQLCMRLVRGFYTAGMMTVPRRSRPGSTAAPSDTRAVIPERIGNINAVPVFPGMTIPTVVMPAFPD